MKNNQWTWKEKMLQNWYVPFVLGIFFLQVFLFLLFGEDSFIAVHDNLDLFVADNKMLANQHAFFGSPQTILFLGGISRDVFGSELSLYNILYAVFPPFIAYAIGYSLKILIGFTGTIALAKAVYQEKYLSYRGLVWLIAAAYAMIPVFPAYGIAFTSVPWLLLILKRIWEKGKWYDYLLLFFYPLLSYFSYFGFFILAYMCLAWIYFIVKYRKPMASFFFAIPTLAMGYVCMEYRLFRQMLFGKTEATIRDTMVNGQATLGEVLRSSLEVFSKTIFHGQDSHLYWVLPICILAFVFCNGLYLYKKQWKKIVTDPLNGVMVFICFNCLIYGLYDWKPFRDLFELLLPPLKGFQFNRTIFFNPFLWYLAFFLALKKLWDFRESNSWKKQLLLGMAAISTLVVLFVPQVYNDFYSNCYHHLYELVKGKESSQLSFGEFYSEDLFTEIKEEIGYQGEWAVAFGMHPAVLEYNGIATLDGYLGLYAESYKEQFGRLIAPALEESEEYRSYFQDWGARAYVYSGSGENTFVPVRKLEISDTKLYIDPQVFAEMGGTYVFSRVKISNEKELGMECLGSFHSKNSPYEIYVYKN